MDESINFQKIIRKIESTDDYSPELKGRLLVIAYFWLLSENEELQGNGRAIMVMRIMWEQSRMICPEIGPFDPFFVFDVLKEYVYPHLDK